MEKSMAAPGAAILLFGYPHGKKRQRKATAPLFILLTLFLVMVNGFAPLPVKNLSLFRQQHMILEEPSPQLIIRLSMARKSVAAAAGGKKKKKKKNKNEFVERNENYKRKFTGKKANQKSLQQTEKSRTEAKASIALPSLKTRAPPWKVLSSKDAKKNMEMEKTRRQRISQGLSTPSEDLPGGIEKGATLSKDLLEESDRALLSWKRFNPSSSPSGVTFVGAYLKRRLPPRLGVPEIAFLGRSNVGKSSLLNCLSNSAVQKGAQSKQSDQARVGKTPGATASVNLYVMTGNRGGKRMGNSNKASSTKPLLGLADLPGFGYAKLSKDVKEQVQEAAERYLAKRKELALGILLVDARRVPSEDDRAVLAALYDMGVPLAVVATKVDKLSNTEREANLEIIRDGLGLPEGQPLCVSSVTGEGTKDLWRIIMEACETRLEEFQNEMEKAGSPNKGREGDQSEVGDDEKSTDHDDDVAYDMGYDWIHDNSVMYEGDNGDARIYEEEDDEAFDENVIRLSENEIQQAAAKDAFKLKNLEQRVRDMEKRGEDF